jgi:hypothetical protein
MMMFCKAVKKEYPPGTFISTPARVMTILQLCLAFTLIAWHAGYPFAGALYEVKSKLMVYQHVMGLANQEHEDLFKQIPLGERAIIFDDYRKLQALTTQSFSEKIKKSFILFSEIPISEVLWIGLSIFIPIMVLKRVEGAVNTVWLLPLVTLFFIIDNRWHATEAAAAKDAHLFPSEEYLMTHYMKGPLSDNILEQQRQLSASWDMYLIKDWGHEEPSENADVFKKQKAKGEFAFHLARLAFIEPVLESHGPVKHSYYFLGFCLFWNLSYATITWSLLKKQENTNPCKIAY